MQSIEFLPFTPQERDVDLLLLEQFHVAPGFVTRFCAAVGLDDCAFVSANHSVFRDNGETDVLLRVESPRGSIAILIEDKIGAAMQPNQCARYHERGRALCMEGVVIDYLAVLCAPRAYLAAVPIDQNWHARIALEELADILEDDHKSATAWRRAVLMKSAARVRRARSVDSVPPSAPETWLLRFKQDYRAFVQENYPQLTATEQRGGDREYFLSGRGLASGIRFKHALFRGEVNLIFERARREVADITLAGVLPEGTWRVNHGGEVHLRAGVESLDPDQPFSAQVTSVRSALEKILEMLPLGERATKSVNLTG
ncbi:PD-(D/E)XK nuclease family protein [Ancylobacter mangrovi]|uniref:PD-(D/E)XK nuclease family protein n=1 Tax=Ancylobacter mangrovi TaxID=2972472 RepID=UPI0021632BCE|nr:PD-(D/E)XK nuclease family protein [Ancylobacter mangrovi]MCS0503501.1 PD-(D/E)XK nuclease family protein [Ancylobacter mangrovi]